MTLRWSTYYFRRWTWIMISFSLIEFGCVDEYRIPVQNTIDDVNISGLISDQIEIQTIVVKKNVSLDQYASVDGTPISKAKVIVSGSDGSSSTFIEVPGKPGVYTAIMSALKGVKYKLTVTVDAMHSYSSEDQELGETSPPDFTLTSKAVVTEVLNQAQNIVKVRKVDLQLTTNLTPTKIPINTFYQVTGQYEQEEFQGNLGYKTCYISQALDYNVLNIFSTQEDGVSEIKESNIMETDADYRFFSQYCFTVKEFLINKSAYDYLKKIRNTTSNSNVVFAAIPGKTKGNIRELDNPDHVINGYFAVASVKINRHFVNQKSLNIPIFSLCNDPNNPFQHYYVPACDDCTRATGSSLTRPSYWK